MKLFAYEVRPDEEGAFDRIAGRLGVTIGRSPETLRPDTLNLCAGCAGVAILGRSRLDRPLLEALHQAGVSAVATRTNGVNHIDLPAARAAGVQICAARYDPASVADYTVMLLLLCLRNYKPALWRMQVNDYSLDGLQGRLVRPLTVGILGTGRIGRQVMRNLSGFGCQILCSDPNPTPEAEDLGGVYVPQEEIWAKCDAVSLHLPLTEGTFHMIDRRTLAKMKDGVILINTARGALMNMEDVTEAVENRKIGALALDVFEDEDGIYHEDLRTVILKNRTMAYLRQFPNVVMTPHMAFYTAEAVEDMVESSITGLCGLLTQGSAPGRVC